MKNSEHMIPKIQMAKVDITDLKLRTIIGANDWERNVCQDVVINIVLCYDAGKACSSDELKDAVDYKAMTKKVIRLVERSKFFLLEKLAASVLDIIMAEKRVVEARVKIDKPFALRFASSVAVELTQKRSR